MSLDATLAIASGGLASITRQIGVISHNVANASTPGYTRQVGRQSALVGDGVGAGVRTGTTTRSIDSLLQETRWQQQGDVAALQVRSDALAAIDAAQGTPGQGDDLASLAGALRNAFTELSADPSKVVQQRAVVSAADRLADGINRVAAASTGQRQAAQDALVADVDTLNAALADVGRLSTRITLLRAQGDSTADLEDQRDAAMGTIAGLADVRFAEEANGDMLVFTASGVQLPTRATTGPLTMARAALGATGDGPALMLGGTDVTAQFSGGEIGANLALRDVELPTIQAELDEFAHDLASRFDAVGLQLFTDGANPVAAAATTPPVQATYLGLAGRIQVNPAVAADATLVRDGTAGTANGQAGYGEVIGKVLTQALGTGNVSSTTPPATSGLGASGSLAARFAAPGSVAGFATAFAGAQAGAAADAATDLSDAQSVQSILDDKAASVSKVSVDTEMSTMIALQNAYSANARIISTVQQLWQDVLNMVGG
ncbi:Flagellar hook-associated protein flgK [Rhodovastum atsumiense]|uniref:Flagellar hook-associated protein 1 n=1 Tax=Rhodovastum atsumiense TaxID=504468 RepID=A0A5M6IX94_9PROT|nr:flagellar hook-associated protein FlgK [Rhodovastum atsumiense]KAA5612467.1 flagellar hook-associated protein FlgK [Rhodovastum atsumiense]CAH2600379.1 Flagellar hook-associated protein flgK [Rhodovastum atsumiense]